MASRTAVYVRIDTELKENAEEILSRLGISPSSAIQMLYSQIVLTKGLPFTPRLPTAIGGMGREQLDGELQKGFDSLKDGKVLPAGEVETMLAREFGI